MLLITCSLTCYLFPILLHVTYFLFFNMLLITHSLVCSILVLRESQVVTPSLAGPRLSTSTVFVLDLMSLAEMVEEQVLSRLAINLVQKELMMILIAWQIPTWWRAWGHCYPSPPGPGWWRGSPWSAPPCWISGRSWPGKCSVKIRWMMSMSTLSFTLISCVKVSPAQPAPARLYSPCSTILSIVLMGGRLYPGSSPGKYYSTTD